MVKLPFCLLISLFLLPAAFAQDWQENLKEVQRLYEGHAFEEAMSLANNNLTLISREVGVESTAYAQALRMLALISYSGGMYPQGIRYASQEVALRRRLGGDSFHLADALYNLGLLKLRKHEAGEALLSLEEALSIYREHRDQKKYQQATLYLADAYLVSGDMQKADSLLQVFSDELDMESENFSLRGMCAYLQYRLLQQRNPQEALSALENAYHFFEEADTLNDRYHHAVVLEAVAYEYQRAREFGKARDAYLKVHQLYEQRHLIDSIQWATVLNNLGMLSTKSQPGEAHTWLKKSYEISSKHLHPDHDRLWAAIDNYAMSLYNRGQIEEALLVYRENLQKQTNTERLGKAYAAAMNNLALIYRELGLATEALSIFYQAEKVRQTDSTAVSRLNLATLYYNLAQTHQSLSQYDSAIYYYKRSTDISKLAQATQSSEYLAAITGMAGLYHDIAYFTEAEIFYAEALRIQENIGGKQTNVYASILSNYALLYQDKGEYARARELLEASLETKRHLLGLDHPDYVAVLSNLALLMLEQGFYEQARRLMEMVVIKYETIYGKGHPNLAKGLMNLARLEIALGNYPEAEPLLKQALQIQKTAYGMEHPAYAAIAIEMANFYMQLGNYEAAGPLLETSRQILKERYGEKHPDYATATQNLAVLSKARGDLKLAEAYLLESLQIDQLTLGKQHPKYAVTLNNLASFYQHMDSLHKALPLLEEALPIALNVLGAEHPLYSSTLLNLALLYQDLDQLEKAATLLDEVVGLRKKLLGAQHPEYAYALYGKAVNAYRRKAYQQAYDIFQEVISLYSWQIREYLPALSEKEKSAFYQRIEPVLNTYRDFVINTNLHVDVVPEQEKQALLSSLYNIQLITKAMLLDASSKIRRSIFQREDPELIELYEQWLDLKEKLAKYYTLSETELRERKLDLRELESRANELEKSLSAGSRLFAQSLQNKELNWKDVQARLTKSEAAAEIIRIQNKESGQILYAALIVEQQYNAPRLVMLPRGSQMEEKNFNYYINAVEFRVEDELSYDLYWRPIGEALSPEIETLYVAPDGIYNKISLNGLYNTHQKRYLLDELNLRMLSSTRDLTHDQYASPETVAEPYAFLMGFPDYEADAAGEILPELPRKQLMADAVQEGSQLIVDHEPRLYDFQSLPGTREEVNFIESLMEADRWQVEKHTGIGASEEKVKQLETPFVLHIATHGYFLSDLPLEKDQKTFGIHMKNVEANPLLRSGLLLAGAARTLTKADSMDLEKEDGVLTAYEAMNLNLNGTEIVVLSACETGLGEVRNGEGVYGLQRAFLVAGARSVLMSLWKVSDESTTELIKLFYRNWLAGQDKFSALAEAQRTIRQKYEEPYHWAPFVLIGL